jgi:hypothetical protein
LYIATFTVVAVNSQQRSAQEVVQRQIEIEHRLNALEARSVEIASQSNDNTNRLDKLEALAIPVTLAEIRKTVEFDHMLMWFVACAVMVTLIKTVADLTFVMRTRRQRMLTEEEQ